MPYRTYQAHPDPSWSAGANNLAQALFPDPARAQAYQNSLLSSTKASQEIEAQRRGLSLQDSLMDAVRGNNPREMMALSAGLGHNHMNAAPGFNLGMAALPDSGVDDDGLIRALVGAGKMPGPDTSVSLAGQDRISGRNADEAYRQAMDVQGLRNQGSMAEQQYKLNHPSNAPGLAESTAAMRNSEFNVQQRLRLNPNMTPQQAWALELGDLTDRMDDMGNLSMIDRGQQSARRINIEGMEPPNPYATPPGPGREDLAFDPGEGTGAIAATQGLWNRTLGQFALTAMGPEQAAQQTNVMRLGIMSALRSTNRPLKIEMDLVNSLLPDTMAFLQNPEVARQQTLQVLDLVGQQYLSDMQLASDPSIPRREQAEYRQRANQLLRAMQTGLQPEAVDRYTGAAGAPPVPRQAFPGHNPGAPQGGQVPEIVPPDRRELFMLMAPEEQQEYLDLLQQLQGGM